MYNVSIKLVAGLAIVDHAETLTALFSDRTGTCQGLKFVHVDITVAVIAKESHQAGGQHIGYTRIAEKDLAIGMLLHQGFQALGVGFDLMSQYD